MKPLSHLIAPLLIISASTPAVTHLRREVGYLHFSAEDDIPVWDLSQSSLLDRSPVSFHLYGDSLYSETIEGWRRWFRLTPDSVLIIREETISELMEYTAPMPTAATGRGDMACEFPYGTHGSDYSHTDIVQQGTYLSNIPIRGRLVTSCGDTVGAVMTEEEINYDRVMRTAPRQPDSGAPAEQASVTERHRISIRHWFVSGPLPVALSISHEVKDRDGHGEYTFENTYTADFGHAASAEEENTRKRPEEEAAATLSDMTVTVSGGVICLSVPVSAPLSITIDILSDSGIPYLHAEREVTDAEPIVLPCGSLPPGRHLIAVSASGHTETRAFSIR